MVAVLGVRMFTLHPILGNHPIASVESAPAVTMALAFSTLARAGRAGHGHAKLGFLNQTSHLQVNSLDSLSMMGVCVHIICLYIHRIVRSISHYNLIIFHNRTIFGGKTSLNHRRMLTKKNTSPKKIHQ